MTPILADDDVGNPLFTLVAEEPRSCGQVHPAGIARMPFLQFALYTFVGAFLWCIPLTFVGEYLGPKWDSFRQRAKYVDQSIAILLVVLIALYLWHKYRAMHEAEPNQGNAD